MLDAGEGMHLAPGGMSFIYALIDPRPGKGVRYVGKTTTTPARRLRQHRWWALRTRRSDMARWICALDVEGLTPQLHVLEVCRSDQDSEAERHWIRCMRRAGCDLINKTDGGAGVSGYRHTAETRARMSAERKRRGVRPPIRTRPHSAESRKLMSVKAKVRGISPATIASLYGPKPERAGQLNCNAKLTDDDVRQIRAMGPLQRGDAIRIANQFGITPPNVRFIVNRKTWRHVE